MAKVKIVKDTAERWLLTYADLMNLLLIFFIILYAMSKVDEQKFAQLAESLSVAFGNTPQTTTDIMQGGSSPNILNINGSGNESVKEQEKKQLEDLEQKISELIDKQDLKGSVDVSMEERGIVITVQASVAFKSGSAEIESGASKTIEDIGRMLLFIPGKQLKVEGHTDTDPIRTSQFPSNWELSSARATNVLRLLVDKVNIDPKVISSVGYGEFRPKVPNTTAENKTANRRVNIVIMRNEFDKSEAGLSKEVDALSPTAVPTKAAKPSPTAAAKH